MSKVNGVTKTPFQRSRIHRKFLSLSVCLSIGISGVVGLSNVFQPAASGASTTSTLAWSTCATTFKCAILSVPASYTNHALGNLSISVIELPATGASPLGDIVLNPGGPGASGISFLTQSVSTFPVSLRKNFNLVSFDPRGVGASDPVNCTSAAGTRALIALDPSPTTASQISMVVKGVKSYVKGCQQETPSKILENVSTLDTVRDLDQLRIALGQAKLNYFGFSYGTYIGELYAKLFPQNIRTMVLDGVIDPALSITTSDQQQAIGFERDLQDFYNWCPTNSTCQTELPLGAKTSLTNLLTKFEHGTTVKARLSAIYGGTVTVNYGVLVTAVIASLYSNQEWPDLAKAVSNAIKGNGALLAAIAYSYAGLQQNGTYSNMTAANTATNCEDNKAPTTISQYKSLAVKMAKAAPDFGASEAWGTLECTYWPVRPASAPAPIANHSKSAILVIGSTGDPATPYAGAQNVAKELGRAVLLTRTGSGHTAYLFSSCIRNWTDSYITTQALPPKGTVCPSN